MSRAFAALLLNAVCVFAIGSLQPSHGQAPSAASAAASQAAGPGADAAAVQTPPAGSFPQFAVVSIKPDKSDAKPQFRFNADGISARKYTPLWLLVAAYDLVEEDRVIGWPAWMLNEYYDVDAKLDEADVPAFAKLSPNDKLLLMQQFFPTRFNMKFHWESRDFKIYELVVAKGGPKLGKPRPLTDEPIPHTLGRWNMKFEAVTMAELCLYILSTEAQLLVVDKTGLTGRYDFSLQWSRPDELVNGQPSDQPLIFTALQEQLGLKLVPAVQPTRVLVIDHIERPSGN